MAEKAEMAEKSGKSGRNFFAVLVVSTLLHQFIRFQRQFPVLATSRSAGAAGQGVVSGWLGSG